MYMVYTYYACRYLNVKRDSYHHGSLRAALLESGIEVLRSSNEGTIGLREIARRVGVTPNAVYRHFSDKESLLVALATEGFRRLAAAQVEELERVRLEPRAALRVAGRSYVRFAVENPALFRLMFGRFSAMHRNGELMSSYLTTERALRALTSAALPVDASEARVNVAAVHAWALVHGISNLVLDGQLEAMSEDIERLIEAVLEHASRSLE